MLTNIDFNQKLAAANDIRINGIEIDLSSVTSFDEMLNNINTTLSSSGVVALAAESGELVLSSNTGLDIVVEQDSGDLLGTGIKITEHGKVTLESAQAIKISSTASTQSAKETALAKMGLSDIGGLSQSNNTGLSIDTIENANDTIDVLSAALEKVSLERATYGAMQNRLGFSINQMTNMMINTESARSRIMDADFAAETANLAKNQLLLQASTAMLGKFNRIQSETILSLLNSIR